MVEWKTITFFVITLLLMAFFAGIEMAYYSANRLNIEIRRKKGDHTANLLTKFIESPAGFIGTTLVGFYTFLIFFALQISTVMEPVWKYFRTVPDVFKIICEITIATLVVFFIGEFIPRAIFRARSNILLSRLAPVMDFFYQIFSPIAQLFIGLAEWLLRYGLEVKVDKQKEALNLSELKNLFEEEQDEERQDRHTHLLENAQEFPNVRIRQCLLPRKEIVGVPVNTPVAEIQKKFVETKLSKLVVYEGNIDHIIGYVHQLDMFDKPASISEVLLPIPAVPESMSAADLIGKFSTERKSIAWVVDEFGGTAGIITMEDVLEELFGEIRDEYDTEKFVEKQIAENEFIFSGRLELDYLEEKYEFEFPENDSETLSGYIISYHETIPQHKERIIIDDFEFDILSVSDTRIEMVKMRKLK